MRKRIAPYSLNNGSLLITASDEDAEEDSTLLAEQWVIISASDDDAEEDSTLLADQRVIITASDEDAEEDSTLLAEQRLLLKRVMEMRKWIAPTNSYWYRKTLEGLKIFTCYLEPSVCWNIFC